MHSAAPACLSFINLPIPFIVGRLQVIVHYSALVQESSEAKVHAESRLQTFTKKLRHAIMHDADVASVWRPAAQVLDVKATLDRKLNNQSFASTAFQVTACSSPL